MSLCGRQQIARRDLFSMGFPVLAFAKMQCSWPTSPTFRVWKPSGHIDRLFWRPGWKEPDRDDFRSRVAQAHSGNAWISDGGFAAATFDLRLPRADVLIVLERPRWLCLVRVLWRSLSRRERTDRPEGCQEQLSWDFLNFIWRFDKDTWPRIEAARIAHGRNVPVIRLRSNREIVGFLASQSAGGCQLAEHSVAEVVLG
jgi:adenylate kinase family enzyme